MQNAGLRVQNIIVADESTCFISEIDQTCSTVLTPRYVILACLGKDVMLVQSQHGNLKWLPALNRCFS